MLMETTELTGAALNWAVAKCEGRTLKLDPMAIRASDWYIWEETPSPQGGVILSKSTYLKINTQYSPSTNWGQGGPIIEKHNIGLRAPNHHYRDDGSVLLTVNVWYARIRKDDQCECVASAADPLTAAMRCYVRLIAGDFIEIPDSLMKGQVC